MSAPGARAALRRWTRGAALGCVLVTASTRETGSGSESRATRSGTVVVATVGEINTGTPLADAVVRFPDLGRLARTNWLGEATLRGVPNGTHRIRVRHLGHAPADAEILVRGDTIGPMFFLEPLSSKLDTVRVTALAVRSGLREFERRRTSGVGRYLEETDLAKERHRSLVLTLSTRFPGLRAWPDPDAPSRYLLQSTRSLTGGSRCNVNVYLDGFPLVQGDLDTIDPGDIAGVELYPKESAPAQYRPSTGGCHVLLLWSSW